jgi:hypothetical protein
VASEPRPEAITELGIRLFCARGTMGEPLTAADAHRIGAALLGVASVAKADILL